MQTPALIAAKRRWLFVFTGESNSGGIALNSDLTTPEAASRSSVQILNNTTMGFENLQIDTNNLISHAGLTDNATHGLENALANETEARSITGASQVYLVKTGQGGSTVAQWATDNGSGYWSTFLTRINAAKSLLATAGLKYKPVVFYSLGINDAIAGTDTATWKTGVSDHLARIRAELGTTTRIVMTKFEGPNMTARAAINTAIDEIAAADTYTRAVSTADLLVRDLNHWSAQGFRALGARVVSAALAS